jgi:hypothetical protein
MHGGGQWSPSTASAYRNSLGFSKDCFHSPNQVVDWSEDISASIQIFIFTLLRWIFLVNELGIFRWRFQPPKWIHLKSSGKNSKCVQILPRDMIKKLCSWWRQLNHSYCESVYIFQIFNYSKSTPFRQSKMWHMWTPTVPPSIGSWALSCSWVKIRLD